MKTSPFDRFSKYVHDPVAFVSEVLGEQLTNDQADVLRALVEHDRFAVKGGHKCGKDFVALIAAMWRYCTQPNARVFVVTCSPRMAEIVWRDLDRVANLVEQHDEDARTDGYLERLLPGMIHYRDQTDERCIVVPASLRMQPAGILTSGNGFFFATDANSISPHVLETMLSRNEPVMFCGVPTSAPPEPFQRAFDPGSGWKTFTMSSVDASKHGIAGIATKLHLDKRLLEYGEGHPFWQNRVLGRFTESLATQP